MSAKKSLHLMTGAMADPIAEQVAKQGLCINGGDGGAVKFQRAADAITYLSINGYIAQKAAHTARQRLLRNVMDAIKASP
jgi:hypothetical protein